MAIVLNNKVSGTIEDGTNSYCDVAYADDYFGNHWDQTKVDAWGNLQQPQKERLLIAGATDLEQLRFVYQIIKTDWRFNRYYNRLTMQVMNFQLLREPVRWYYYQVLQFPRNLDVNPVTGALYIPPDILAGQCEQAISKLTFDKTAIGNRMQGITQNAVAIGRGQIHVSQQYGAEGTQIAPDAWEMVKRYVVRNTKWRRG